MKKLLIMLTTLLLFVLVFVKPVSALLGDFEIPGSDTPINVLKLLFGEKVEEVFTEQKVTMTNYTVLQYLFFPFAALWMVIYGILEEIRIFRRQSKLQAGISFLIAIIAGATGTLVIFVRTTFRWFGFWGFGAFALLLFVGVFAWAGVRLWSWGAPWTSRHARRRAIRTFEVERDIMRLRDTYQDAMLAGDAPTARQILNQINKLRQELRQRRHGGP